MTPDPAPYGADLPRPVTPGPWEALDVDDEDVPVVVEHPPAFEGVVTIAMTKAWNAHAIAAVPDYVDALDAANAEVLALRAERDALLADLAGVLGREATLTVRCERAEGERDALREVVERVVTLCHHYEDRTKEWDARYVAHRIRDEVAHILPAPTEPSNLYPPARGAVAPTTTPQAPGGSGANTGEVGRG